MAKTTSEIIAENQKRNEEIQELLEEMDKYDEEHAEEFATAKEKTEAVLNGTSDKLVKPDNIRAEDWQSIVSMPTYENIFSYPSAHGIGGFILGVLLTTVIFYIKIKKIKKDSDIRINEARSALDRMLKIASKE